MKSMISIVFVIGILFGASGLKIHCWRCIGDISSNCTKVETSGMEKTSCDNGVCYTGVQDDGLVIRNCYPETKAATFCKQVVELGSQCSACDVTNYCNIQKVKADGKILD